MLFQPSSHFFPSLIDTPDTDKTTMNATLTRPFLVTRRFFSVRPRASNPRVYPKKPLAQHLQDAGEQVTLSEWVKITNIPPVSSLDAMLDGINQAIDHQAERGILHLDADWDRNPDTVPFLEDTEAPVQKAHVILSPFGRPMGWQLQLQNRSLAHALCEADQVFCAWKQVTVASYDHEPRDPFYEVSDATVRVEHCKPETRLLDLINVFSRYDLRSRDSIEEWGVREFDGTNVPLTYLVHFADASWARAAVREQQSRPLNGEPLRLAQFPRQIP